MYILEYSDAQRAQQYFIYFMELINTHTTIYLAELFCRIRLYLAELFCNATFYLDKVFRHATFYLAELFRQIAFPNKILKKFSYDWRILLTYFYLSKDINKIHCKTPGALQEAIMSDVH